MKQLNFRNFLSFSSLAIIGGLLAGCEKSPKTETPTPEPNTPSTYNIWVNAGSEASGYGFYILQTEDLMKDTTLSALGSGVDATAIQYSYGAFFHDGYYYHAANDGLVKAQIQNGKLVEVDNVTNIGWPEKYIVDEGNLLVYNFGEMITVDIATMTIKDRKPYNVPEANFKAYNDKGEETGIWADGTSFMAVNGNYLFMGYNYTKYDPYFTKVSDTAYVYRVDYPSLQNPVVLKDTRAGYVAGVGRIQGDGYTYDEEGNLYFGTSNWATFRAERFGIDLTMEKGNSILRIKKGESTIDQNYQFVFPVTLGGISRLLYMGNNLALVNGKFVVSLHDNSILTDLSQRGIGEPSGSYEVVENGKMYKLFKSPDARWFIYEYNTENNQLTKGIEIDGGVASVVRVDAQKNN
jgi:hypothetical protein